MNYHLSDSQQFSVTRLQLFLLIVVAYSFSFFIRMIWVFQFQDTTPFFWNDQLMINTNDGYYFASAAQHLLDGWHTDNSRIPGALASYPGLVYITVFLTTILPFSLETVILYMPAVMSSLVVIPIILITRLYKQEIWGFLAALLGSIAWSYYNRTMIGYYDTDMFSAMAPMFILYFLINTIHDETINNALYASIAIIIYPFLYDQGLSIIYAMGLIYMGFMIIFHRKENFTYQSIILIAIALINIPLFIKLILLSLFFILFIKRELSFKVLIPLAVVFIITFLITGNVFNIIWIKITGYTVRGVAEEGLHFYGVTQTVREAGKIPFEVMANRISGSTLGVLISFVGYIVLVIKHRPFILALPLIGIGVFSLWGGLRFTVYAVPIAALSAVYFVVVLSNFIKEVKLKYVFIFISIAGLLYPNVSHIIGYKVPTVFTVEEVKVLDSLNKISQPQDYTVAWWDYGYPIWFYSDTNTLIDGGKHHHDNYIVSKILTSSSQKEAAVLSRLAVETYVGSGYKTVADTLFRNHDEDQVNVENFFDELHSDTLPIPKATRDVFLYLPFRMLDIFPTVKVFSNIDLDTGEKLYKPFFYRAQKSVQDKEKVDFGKGVYLNLQDGTLSISQQKVSINQIVTTGFKPDGKIGVNRQMLHSDGSLVILTLQNYNAVLIVDREIYNSTYVQMFFLENYDKRYFEPVISSPYAKVYKVKI